MTSFWILSATYNPQFRAIVCNAVESRSWISTTVVFIAKRNSINSVNCFSIHLVSRQDPFLKKFFINFAYAVTQMKTLVLQFSVIWIWIGKRSFPNRNDSTKFMIAVTNLNNFLFAFIIALPVSLTSSSSWTSLFLARVALKRNSRSTAMERLRVWKKDDLTRTEVLREQGVDWIPTGI